MTDNTEIFVRIDVAKVRNAIAIADGERGSEVRFLGESGRVRGKQAAGCEADYRKAPSGSFIFAMMPDRPAMGCIV
jgi:hypothetical protein